LPIRRRAQLLVLGALLTVAAAATLASLHVRQEHLLARLLTADTEAVVKDRDLTAFAESIAKPLYAANCARCHGAQLTGNTDIGAPNLTDDVWLFDRGEVFDIERTILYGVRSGISKAHNVTDMPAFGSTGRLSAGEIRNLVQYIDQLSRRPHQAQAAIEGRAVFHDAAKGNCVDCHGDGARGNSSYGAPDLTRNVWNSGADDQSLYDSIYYGEHHIMPGFFGTLSLEQIRALAVYVYMASHPAGVAAAMNTPHS
jgi:cytochrome c oxidase cbb3-type subunit 3